MHIGSRLVQFYINYMIWVNYYNFLVMMTTLYNIIITVTVLLLLTNKQPICVN